MTTLAERVDNMMEEAVTIILGGEETCSSDYEPEEEETYRGDSSEATATVASMDTEKTPDSFDSESKGQPKVSSDDFPLDELSLDETASEVESVIGMALKSYVLATGRVGAEEWRVKELGIKYLGESAARGSDWAAYMMGLAWTDGKCGLSVNPAEAAYWLELSLSGKCRHKHMAEACKQDAMERLKDISIPTRLQFQEIEEEQPSGESDCLIGTIITVSSCCDDRLEDASSTFTPLDPVPTTGLLGRFMRGVGIAGSNFMYVLFHKEIELDNPDLERWEEWLESVVLPRVIAILFCLFCLLLWAERAVRWQPSKCVLGVVSCLLVCLQLILYAVLFEEFPKAIRSALLDGPNPLYLKKRVAEKVNESKNEGPIWVRPLA